MKEVLVHPGSRTEIIDSAVPSPDALQVVIKVVVSGTNPKDWKLPEWTSASLNQGDDIAGIVHTIGSGVKEFKPGDRVAAFHEMGTPGGSYAEYGVAWDHTTFHIPGNISFEEAATLPLAFMTSALGLYYNLRLPSPWTPTDKPTPLIVYGGSSAVGSFAIKLAKLSNIHPIIAIAGAGASFVESLIDRSKGDAIVDYRRGDSAVITGIRDAVAQAGCDKVEYAFDATTASNSWANIASTLTPTGSITFVLYDWQGKGLPETLKLTQTHVGVVHGTTDHDSSAAQSGLVVGARAFGLAWYRLLGLGLREGWMTPHPHEDVKGGLKSVGKVLEDLKAGKASAFKYVLRISETEGI
ncbi:hypothetical protein P7C71_g1999, partial [Lecanoromycetidae sp. Uapishka_2]